jgi:UDP-N-acetylmuramyl pentapeptide synthase
MAKHFASLEDLQPVLSELLRKEDTVLVKASRGMAFERIIQWISQ